MSETDFNKENSKVVVDEKPEKRSLVELKSGKLVFKQKPVFFDKHSETMQEIVKFRDMLEQRIEKRDPPLDPYPDEHKPVIAKLANESDKTITVLAKHIRNELLPAQDEDEDNINSGSADVSASLPLSTVEAVIKSILCRINYGLDAPHGGKLPASLCVWRWEVKEEHRGWLPKAAREKADGRLAERVQAKKDLAIIFESLSQEERDTILDPKGVAKLPTKDTNKASASPAKLVDSDLKELAQQPKKQQKMKSEDTENDVQSEPSTSKAGPGRPKKEADPEKVAKEKEKLEKKAAKVEKEKKEKEAQNKSRSIMANFFGKHRANSARASPTQESEPGGVISGSSSSLSAFEKTFKPFVVKKDAEVAPTNWFLDPKTNRLHRREGNRDIIVIDCDDSATKKEYLDIEMEGVQELPLNDVGQMNTKEHLASIISSLPPSAHKSFTSVPRRRLSAPRHITRTILSQLNEAEIADNPSQVRWLLSVLRNRELLPAKILIFREDARPGYFGTWTRHSRIIGPRTPFARDPVTLDYAYDSGEEWEEEGTGDADDVDEGAEEDDGATEADSDLDSWLVDDDVEEIGTPLEERGAEPLSAVLNFPVKRKAEGGERKIDKKRKIVVPLVPFAKGPCWESDVGQCTYEPFEPYRIQLFNDTPYPIDPFTFISAPQGKIQKILKETSSTVSPTFAIPFLPDRLVATSGTTPTAAASTSSTATTAPSATTKRTSSTATPKTSFPEAHLPILVSKINALATSNITFLVESIYQDLRTHKVKKNAIEAKVKEVGEKCKEKKVWIVKPGVAISQVVAPS